MAVKVLEDSGDIPVKNENIEYTPLGAFAFMAETPKVIRKVTIFANDNTELVSALNEYQNSYIITGEPLPSKLANGLTVSLSMVKKGE